MKKILTTLILLQLTNVLIAQDPSTDAWIDNNADTEIILPINQQISSNGPRGKLYILKSASGQEEFLKLKTTDSFSDFFAIRNATGVDNKFVPAIYSHNQTDNRISLSFGVSTTPSNDFGTEPLLKFETRTYSNGESQADPASLLTRPMCAWTNLNVVKMILSANGNLGIGTTSPQAQLHTTGTVRFTGISSGTGSGILAVDASGNVLRTNLPSSSTTAFITNSPIFNSIPRFNASNVLVNSQIFDDGTSIGIGGSPASNAKVTIYGVINQLSDAREKTNIEPIENALSKLNQINGYYYDWKNTDNKQVGLIAQEVEKVLPEAVSENEKGTKFLNYDGITPVLVEAIKEQQKMIQQQAKQIEQLTKEIEKLKKN